MKGFYVSLEGKNRAPGLNFALENNLAMLFKIKPQK
jgi:hypothetical protein